MSESDAPWPARVVVGVSGSLGSHTALCRAAREARRRNAELWPVLAWEPPGGELGARRTAAASPCTVDWQRLARERLLAALDDVFGAAGPGVALHPLVARGAPGRALVEIADREDDVLVVGAGRRGRLRRALSRSVSRYCLAHATCSVLAVPPSPLAAQLASVHRRNAWRWRLDTRRLEGPAEALPPDA
ncbi:MULTISPECIES: universal stress protein [unclassified Streptomyces]|uniref:universal stress protein n=1 Tax=unclassified Streptomyces TaxID=2593676 RepID=UPI0033D4981A